MANIDALYFLTPLAVIGFSFGIVIYWRSRKGLPAAVLLYSFVAYFAAIAIKEVIQLMTYSGVVAATAKNPYELGLYYGSQTVFLEVGVAILLAYYGARRGSLKRSDAAGYGLSLGLWENGVLIAIPLLLDYIIYYVFAPGSPTLNSTLIALAPALFFGPARALPLIALAILERASSELAHFAWGYLAVLGAVTGRKRYWAVALPMGLVDFLVPFEDGLGAAAFEGIVFSIALASIIVTLAIGRREKGASLPYGAPKAG